MKNFASLVLIGMMAATAAFADGSSSPAPQGKYHPCVNIQKACRQAGFEPRMHKKNNKGLYLDCMKPITEGQSVPGVTVDSKDVQECKVRMEKRKERHEEKKSNGSNKS